MRLLVLFTCGWMVAATLVGCEVVAGNPNGGVAAEERSDDMLRFEGKVVHLDFEGGFWGLVSRDGQNYDPGGVPPEFQVENLPVRVTAKRRSGMVSFRMWGTLIEIVQIERLDASDSP